MEFIRSMYPNLDNLFIFISYSSVDEVVAKSISSQLDSLQLPYFLDRKSIQWGRPFEADINQGIRDCSHLLVIISPASVNSSWVAFEVGQARALNKTILPYLTHPSAPLPSFLSKLHHKTTQNEIITYFKNLTSGISKATLLTQRHFVRIPPSMVQSVPPYKNIRRYLVSSDLLKKGLIQRLGRGTIRNIFAWDKGYILIIATCGAMLFDIEKGEVQWEIDCPINIGLLDPYVTVLALGCRREIFLWNVSAGKLLHRLERLEGEIRSLAFSPNGKKLASGNDDRTLSIWDIESGKLENQIVGQNALGLNNMDWIAFSPDGKHLTFGDWHSGKAELWNIEADNFNLSRCFEEQAYDEDRVYSYSVPSVTFSPDGKWLAPGFSGLSFSPLWLWDGNSGQLVHTLQMYTRSRKTIAFSPNSKWLASSCVWENLIRLWDTETGQLLSTIKTDQAEPMEFSPDGRYLVYNDKNTGYVCDALTGRLMFKVRGTFGEKIVFSPDGKNIINISNDNAIQIWNIERGQLLRTLEGREHSLNLIIFSQNGKYLIATGQFGRSVKIWDTETGILLHRLEGYIGVRPERGNPTLSLRFEGIIFAVSPDGRHLCSGDVDNTVRIWNIQTGRMLHRFEGPEGRVNSITFCPNSLTLASGGDDSIIRIWDVKTGILVRKLEGHTSGIGSLSFSSDAKYLASGGCASGEELLTRSDSDKKNYDRTVRIWDVSTGQTIFSIDASSEREHIHVQDEHVAMFSPDSKRVYCSYRSAGLRNGLNVRFLELETGQLLSTQKEDECEIVYMALAPNGKSLIILDRQSSDIKILDALTFQLQRTLEYKKKLDSITFSPNGKYLVITDKFDNSMQVWDFLAGILMYTINELEGRISSVTFSFDSKYLVAGDETGTLRLWDIGTGNLERHIEGHAGFIHTVTFISNSSLLVSVGADGSVGVWQINNE